MLNEAPLGGQFFYPRSTDPIIFIELFLFNGHNIP
jgi:hypothetical protein